MRSNLTGISGAIFKIGKGIMSAVKSAANVLEVRKSDDTDFATLRALRIQSGYGINDIPTIMDVKGTTALIQFSFAGASAPSAGSNTNKYGFCHTTGGSYTAGDIVFDSGTALLKLNATTALATTTAITGTISLVANGLYFLESGSWTLKGDGSGSSTGMEKVIEIPFAFGSGATIDSTTSIPNGSRVTRVETVITQAFNGSSPTLAVVVNGSSPLTIQATTENDITTVDQWENLDVKDVGATNAGLVRLNYTSGSSTAGAGKVFVTYVTPLA